ncbi:MAG: RNA 2',3'-cyclic phosphodiesterase [Gammaproteobacteria bacterium]|nr:RNA 2',3'-cyclic phosphodiesterase [Gammaproteobacteria bacterium]
MSAPESNPDAMAESQAKQRVFFALWPDAEVRAALDTLARQHARHNGHAVVAENLHVTLAFVGGVTAEQRACMEAAAAALTAAPFAVTFDTLGFWLRPRILWAGARVMPPELADLVAALNAALAPCGYRPETRPFQAHITLARKARRSPPVRQIPPVVWRADAFCLVESVASEQGSEYRVIGRWPLRG